MKREKSYKIKLVYKINGNTEKQIRTNKKKSSNNFFSNFFLYKEKKAHNIIIHQSHKHKQSSNNLSEKTNKPPYIIFDLLVNICRKIAQKKKSKYALYVFFLK
jgi:hypothetical protein